MPADGAGLPVVMIGDFGTSPFPAQLWKKYTAPHHRGRAESDLLPL